MEKGHNPTDAHDDHRDFLADVSSQFGRRDEEKDFLDSISQGPAQEDIQVNVGERVKTVREKRNLSLEDISQRTDLSVSLLQQIENGSLAPPWGPS